MACWRQVREAVFTVKDRDQDKWCRVSIRVAYSSICATTSSSGPSMKPGSSERLGTVGTTERPNDEVASSVERGADNIAGSEVSPSSADKLAVAGNGNADRL